MFLSTAANKPWVATQWLADFLLWQIYLVAAFPLLHLLMVGLFAISHVALPGLMLRRERIPPLLMVFLLFLCPLIGSIQWMLRPVLFGFICFAISYCHAQSLYAQRRTIGVVDLCGVAVLFLLWANLHSSFPLGLS